MVAYSFKPRFVIPIELGEKRQTIRARGKKRHARVGDTLQFYTGPRMKPRKIGEATCTEAGHVILDFRGQVEIIIGEESTVLTTPAELDAFAVSDGFADWTAMRAFWADTHDIENNAWAGLLIRWGDTFRGGLALNPSTAGA